MSGYLEKIASSVEKLGLRTALQIAQCGGGTVPARFEPNPAGTEPLAFGGRPKARELLQFQTQ
jgi:hypothetical protein